MLVSIQIVHLVVHLLVVVIGNEGGALGHVETWQNELLGDLVNVLHSEDVRDSLLVIEGHVIGVAAASAWHEVGDAHSQLFLDDSVSDAQLLLQVSDVVVSLSDVKLRSVLFAFEVNLLQVQQVLVVEDIKGFNLVLYHLLLVLLLNIGSLVLQVSQVSLQLSFLLIVLLNFLLQPHYFLFNLISWLTLVL